MRSTAYDPRDTRPHEDRRRPGQTRDPRPGAAAEARRRTDTPVARMELPMDWGAAVWAALTAGVVFLLVEMLLVWAVLGQSPWLVPRMIAAIVQGPAVLEPPIAFAPQLFGVALLIHFGLSLLYGLVMGWFMKASGVLLAIVTGLLISAVIYGLNFHLFADAMFPWFAALRGPLTFAAHLLFGLTAALVYLGLRRTHPPDDFHDH